MSIEFSETTPGGTVSGTKSVDRRAEGAVIEYEFGWSGEGTVTVRLSDRIPADDLAEYGFHDQHEPPEWSGERGEIELEASLGNADRRTFVLGLVAAEGTDLPDCTTVPALDVDGDWTTADATGLIDRARESLESVVDRDDDVSNGDEVSDAVASRNTTSGGRSASDAATALGGDTAPGGSASPSDDGGSSPSPGDEQFDVSERAGRDDGPQHVVDGGAERTDGEQHNEAERCGGASGDSLVAELLSELESDEVPESDRSRLRAHLADGRPESESVQLEYVQRRLGEFDAYVDALEDLLAVHGNGDDGLAELDERMVDLADEVQDVRRQQDDLADRVDDLSAAIDALSTDLDSLRAAHGEDVDELRAALDRHREATADSFDTLHRSIRRDVDALEAEIETLDSIRRTLVDGLQRADGRSPPAIADDAVDDPAETRSVPDADSPTAAGAASDLRDGLETARASNFQRDDAYAPSASAGLDGDDDTAERRPDESGWTSPDAPDATDGGDDDSETGTEDPVDVEVADANGSGDPEGSEGPGDDPASSIFEIGDVEPDDGVDEELPTIDFEDV